MEIKKLKEERAELVGKLTSIEELAKAEERNFSDSEKKEIDETIDKLAEKDTEIQRAERLAEVKANQEVKRPETREEKRVFSDDKEERLNQKLAAYGNLFQTGITGVTEENRKVFDIMHEKRALSTTAAAGGESIDSEVANFIYQSMSHYGPFIPYPGAGISDVAATVVRTSKGGAWKIPTTDDTSNTGALISEGGDASATVTDPTYSNMTLNSYKYSSKVIKYSYEIERDSEVDFANHLFGLCAERLGRKLNTDFTTANGSSKPNGIDNAATAGKTSASSTAFTRNEILDTKFSVNMAYRQGPKVGWMMHDSIYKELLKLVDGNSLPLFQMGNIVGAPAMALEGHKIFINNDLDSSLASGQNIIFFGDWSKFYVRLVGGLRFRILDELYAANDQKGIVLFQSADSDLVDTAAIKYLTLT